jgi:O-antigen/teichoic acid export membrane protein
LLGIYALARGLSEMPVTLTTKIIHPIALPAFSTMQDDKVKLCATLFSLTKVVAIFGLPLLAFLVIFSETILSTAYGEIYSKAAIPFSILSIYSFLLICGSLFTLVYIAIGRPDVHRAASFFRTALFLLLIYPFTIFLGLLGASLAVLISMILLLAILLMYANKLLNFRIIEYLRIFLLGLKLSLVVIIPSILLIPLNHHFKIASMGVGIFCCISSWIIGFLKMNSFRTKTLRFDTFRNDIS